MRRSLFMAVTAILLVVPVLPAYALVTPVVVQDEPDRRFEWSAYSDGSLLLYTASAPGRRNTAVVLAKDLSTSVISPVTGTPTFGFSGGIDPVDGRVLFQMTNAKRTRSDIYLADRDGNDHEKVVQISTPWWEWEPRISQHYITFFRDYIRRNVWRTGVFAYDRTTGTTRRLAEYKANAVRVYNGSVGYLYATWTICDRNTCRIRLHRLSNDFQRGIPTSGDLPQYAPVVHEGDAGETIFFIRSGHTCGRNVNLWSLDPDSLGQPPVKVMDLPTGVDTQYDASLAPSLDATGGLDYLFTRIDCDTGRNSIWRAPDVVTP